jgi:hypothetical protein
MTKVIIIKKKENECKVKEGEQEECNIIISSSSSSSSSLSKSKSLVKKLPPPEEITINNYALLMTNGFNYKVVDLKNMCTKIQKEYGYKKMKTTGNKVEMKQNIYDFYNYTFHCIKIQLKFKKYLRKKMILLRGPALKNRDICINETDFYTLDPVREIPDSQFYSYEEDCGDKKCCYGFDIASICNLILNDNLVDSVANLNCRLIWKQSSNPYNRNIIPHNIIKDILKIIKLDRILNSKRSENGKKKNKNSKNVNNQHENNGGGNIVLNHNGSADGENENGNIIITLPQDVLTPQQRYRQNVLHLFQNINFLGHYSDPDWFLHLTYHQHITFLRELMDIWNYRAELSYSARISIYPPYGNPFPPHVTGWLMHQFYEYLTLENIVNINMVIIERLTTTAVQEADRCLGANFVLCALTLVSTQAREALPWLYQSVMHV